MTIGEFILEMENRLRWETRHKTENSSNVNLVCNKFTSQIIRLTFLAKLKKSWTKNSSVTEIHPKFLLEVKIATGFLYSLELKTGLRNPPSASGIENPT